MSDGHSGCWRLALCALVVAPLCSLGAPPDTSDAVSPWLIDEMDALPALVDGPEEPSPTLWELMTLPPGDRWLRARIQDPGSREAPSHLLQGSARWQHVELGGLLHRDPGEPNPTDLWRLGARWSGPDAELWLGDIQVDHGLGWTVSSSPSWSSASDPFGPLRRPSRAIRINHSREEGWGWKGVVVAAVGTELHDNPATLWAGILDLDSRPDDQGRPIPYGFQGNHPPDRPRSTVRVLHLGGSVPLPIPAPWGKLQALAAANQLGDHLSPATSSARFRGIDDRRMAGGLSWQRESHGPLSTLAAEAAVQDHGAAGGGVVVRCDASPSTSVVTAGYAAHAGFSSLHARPWLAFGNDPAGRAGIQVASVQRIGQTSTLTAGAAMEHRAHPALADDTRSVRLFARQATDVHPDHRLTVSGVLSTGESTWRQPTALQMRGHWRIRRDGGAGDLRLDGSWDHNGAAGLFSAGVREGGAVISAAITASVVFTTGAGAPVNVVEPTAPGLFPVRRVGSDQLRLAGRVDIHPPGWPTLWIAGAAAQPMRSRDIQASTTLSLGLDWRY